MDIEQLARNTYTCPRCLAGPAQPCVTKSGKPAGRNHSRRSAVLYQAWRNGFAEGRRLRDRADQIEGKT